MCTSYRHGRYPGKMRSSHELHRGGLEFRIKYHLNRERGEGCRPVREESMVFRKDDWSLRRTDGGGMTEFVWVWC